VVKISLLLLAKAMKMTSFLLLPQVTAISQILVLPILDISEKDVNNTNSFSFSCTQTSGIPVENLRKENDRIFSFKAPYLRHSYGVNTNLHFKLTLIDNNNPNEKITHNAKVVVKRVHRSKIFQGGVALGAYEAGVVEKLLKNNENKKREGVEIIEKRPLFDIVAGTSIGAMNGAIVVSSVTKEGAFNSS
jgi:hypothetical protein